MYRKAEGELAIETFRIWGEQLHVVKNAMRMAEVGAYIYMRCFVGRGTATDPHALHFGITGGLKALRGRGSNISKITTILLEHRDYQDIKH